MILVWCFPAGCHSRDADFIGRECQLSGLAGLVSGSDLPAGITGVWVSWCGSLFTDPNDRSGLVACDRNRRTDFNNADRHRSDPLPTPNRRAMGALTNLDAAN